MLLHRAVSPASEIECADHLRRTPRFDGTALTALDSATGPGRLNAPVVHQFAERPFIVPAMLAWR